MTDRPTPERRYLDGDHQAAYEVGWHQCYDHDSFALLDRIEGAVDGVVGDAERCRRRAAMLEGAADALLELAEQQHEGAVFAAELGGGAGVVSQPLLDSRQVALLLGISGKQVQRMARAGEIPTVRFGRAYRFRPESIERWLTDRERNGHDAERK